MRQQISRLAVGLFLALFAAQSMAMSEDAKRGYREYLASASGSYTVALASDATGRSGGWGWGHFHHDAKKKALEACRKRSSSPNTCKVVDVDGQSAWWRGGAKGNPAASSYVPSSSNASVSTPKGPTQSVVSSSSNTAFHESECKVIWKLYGSGDAIIKSYNATTTQQWDMKCWDYISEDGKTWIGSNKSSTSTASSSSSSASSSSGYAGMVWCATHSGVKRVAISSCSSQNGFFSKSQAEHAYRRLKSASSSASNSSSASMVWCATNTRYWKTNKSACWQAVGDVFDYESAAAAYVRGHRRLKLSPSTSTASSSSSKLNSSSSMATSSNYVDDPPYLDKRYYLGGGGVRKYLCFDPNRRIVYSLEISCINPSYPISKADFERLRRLNSSKKQAVATAIVWCATSGDYSKTTNALCLARGGKRFNTADAARIEHLGLKFKSSTSLSSISEEKIWCATSGDYSKTTNALCLARGGKRFNTADAARIEHLGLKFKSSTSLSSISEEKIWCATSRAYYKTTKALCLAKGGKGFNTAVEAGFEYTQLKSRNYGWCVSANQPIVNWSASSGCKNSGGTIYSSKTEAEAAYSRLKSSISFASLTIRSNVRGDRVYINGKYKGSTRLDLDLRKGRHTIRIEKEGYKTYEEQIDLSNALTLRASLEKIPEKSVQTVDKSSLELEFWQTIKDSDDPDMYRAYLAEYPDGKFVRLAKLKIKKLGGTDVAESSIPNLDYGRYHALVIGNNNYRNFRDLTTAISDAREVGRVLEAQYGFDVTLLTNATRQRTLKTVNNFRQRLSVKDNLLIYFAGHGHLHKEADEGYWLPVDAEQNDFTNWISNADVIASVRAMEAKHVLVLADSCFSGTLVRAIKVLKKPSDDYLKKSVKRKARTAISSGGLEPVTDVGGGKHSIFAHSLLGLLRENDGVLNATNLFASLRDKVELNSDQVPVLGNIRKAGHDGGDFLFVRQ